RICRHAEEREVARRRRRSRYGPAFRRRASARPWRDRTELGSANIRSLLGATARALLDASGSEPWSSGRRAAKTSRKSVVDSWSPVRVWEDAGVASGPCAALPNDDRHPGSRRGLYWTHRPGGAVPGGRAFDRDNSATDIWRTREVG